ncbi:hypothetical protein HNR46_002795 [Haloferula luteola]|uniref:Uncharacterized protein n=1 Tax=Haloferula luteola TaxID=595692 RepID=A0A840VFF5_9BACT|nr:hypothetical protein [Haloferula luteola]
MLKMGKESSRNQKRKGIAIAAPDVVISGTFKARFRRDLDRREITLFSNSHHTAPPYRGAITRKRTGFLLG